VVLHLDYRPIGLLFAGSSVATILNPIAAVHSWLGFRIGFCVRAGARAIVGRCAGDGATRGQLC
jgi:hypothetical protein